MLISKIIFHLLISSIFIGVITTFKEEIMRKIKRLLIGAFALFLLYGGYDAYKGKIEEEKEKVSKTAKEVAVDIVGQDAVDVTTKGYEKTKDFVSGISTKATTENLEKEEKEETRDVANPEAPYYELNNNIPLFTDEEKARTDAFELYSPLDHLGRCQVAYANICPELMPTEDRGEIGMMKPTGWHSVKYPEVIEDKYLYNRCHLIAFCLAGENDNPLNLITGTRYFNVQGMLPFEEKVLYYVKDTGNHVLYRVNPVFENNNLVASGVVMEAYSVEDEGKGVCFNVYVLNQQPGVGIDYETGDSWIK